MLTMQSAKNGPPEAKLLAAVMDAINVGVIVLDQSECVVCWNPWVEKFPASRSMPHMAND